MTRFKNRIRDEQGRKQCNVCHEYKDPSEFASNKARVDGLSYNCKKCQRGYVLMARYGITQEEFDAILAQQAGKCAICNRDADVLTMGVDHNHATGEIRGILCLACNGKLGWYEEYTTAVGEYLGRTSTYRRGTGGNPHTDPRP